jgi:hypothetical protein
LIDFSPEKKFCGKTQQPFCCDYSAGMKCQSFVALELKYTWTWWRLSFVSRDGAGHILSCGRRRGEKEEDDSGLR